MSASIISAHSVSTGGSYASLNLTVQAGDLIVAATGAFFNFAPTTYTCTDTAGNTYEIYIGAAPGFGHIAYAWAIAKTSGTITITMTENSPQNRHMFVANARWPDGISPPLAQFACNITPRNLDPPGGGFGTRAQTNEFALADSFVITASYLAGGAPTISASLTGDTLLLDELNLCLFVRAATGPGLGHTTIINSTSAGPDQLPIMSGVFSRSLTRPPGTVSQYATQPGSGFTATPGNEGGTESILWPGIINRPLNCTLPYSPQIGSLVCVGVTQTAWGGTTPIITDTYGNTYTLRALSVPGGGGNDVLVAIYTSIIVFLPPTGLPFTVTASILPPYSVGPYQPTSVSLSEQALTGKAITEYQSALFNSLTAGVVKSDPLTVLSGSYLFAVAAHGSGVNQDTVAWTAQGGFTRSSQSNFIQVNGQQTNAVRSGPSCILDMYPGADGTFNAKVLGQVDGLNTGAAGIAMIGIGLSAFSLACPTTSTGTIGVPFTATLQVSGGMGPYTFSIIGGSLPSGLSLDSSTGIISGIPTAAGVFTYTARVTDANGAVAEITCQITISTVSPTVSANCRTTLHLWQHSQAPQVEITKDRNDDWTDCGTPGLKFFQGFKLDADTFGANKTIQIRSADDSTLHVPQPSPINHQGRQTKPYSFATPFLAHSVRRESLDSVAWRKFGITYVWEPSPEFTYTWKTQRTSHGLSGFHHVQRMLFAYASSDVVTLTVAAFDGVSPAAISLPSTGGVPKKVVIVLSFNKGLTFQYGATSPAPFQIWKEDIEVMLGSWSRQGGYLNYPLLGGNRGDQASL